MKPFSLFTTGMAALLLSVAPALGTPPTDVPPATGPAKEEEKPVDKKQSAFLGVVSAPLSKITTEQLGLPAGEGVAIHAVAPQGPAAKAGLATNDIITRINGCKIGSPADLSKTMAAQQPGDSVHLSLIQKGKTAECDVTLGERPAELNRMRSVPLDTMLKNFSRGRESGELDGILRFEADAAQEDSGNNGMEIQIASSIHMIDGQGSVEMKSNKGHREIIVRDKENKVTWSGPWNTGDEKNAAPPEVCQRLNDLNLEKIYDSSRLHLNLPNGKPQERDLPGR
jgi:hypothetical protein